MFDSATGERIVACTGWLSNAVIDKGCYIAANPFDALILTHVHQFEDLFHDVKLLHSAKVNDSDHQMPYGGKRFVLH